MAKLKSFDEFWSSLSDEEMVKISKNAQERVAKVSAGNPNQALGTKVAVLSTMMTMQLLSRYHNWLSEQLESDEDC